MKDDGDADGWDNDNWSSSPVKVASKEKEFGAVNGTAEPRKTSPRPVKTSPRPVKTEKKKEFGADELEEWLNA